MATVQPLKSAIDRQPEQLMLIDGQRVHAAWAARSMSSIIEPDTSSARFRWRRPTSAVNSDPRVSSEPAWSGLSGQARARAWPSPFRTRVVAAHAVFISFMIQSRRCSVKGLRRHPAAITVRD